MTSPAPPPMFCPFCGTVIVKRDGEQVCPAGNMPLAPRTALRLRAAFVQRTATPSAAPLPFRVGGRWYCPGCGDRMATDGHGARCPRCALHLNEFLVELVELHGHGGELDRATGEPVYDGGRR